MRVLVLSAHNLLIAAIFTTYMGAMAGLIAYACATGQEPPGTDQDEPEPDRSKTGIELAA